MPPVAQDPNNIKTKKLSKISVLTGNSKPNSDSIDMLGQSSLVFRTYETASIYANIVMFWVKENIILSRRWFVFFPLLVTLCVSAGYLTLLNIAISITLPSVNYFNFVHIALFVLCERTISCVRWTFEQTNTFQNSWSLVFHHTTFKELSDPKKSASNTDKIVKVLLILFLVADLITAYDAEWTQVGQFGSNLGYFDCIPPEYLNETLSKFKANGEVISGDIDFAQIYAYGLPLADGLAVGYAPWPSAAPLSYFTIVGKGPVIILKVDCIMTSKPFYGVNQTVYGSGGKVLDSYTDKRSFNVDIEVYLPTVGFRPDSIDVETDWVSHKCLIQGQAASGLWYFSYRVDEWQMVTTGLGVNLVLDGFPTLTLNESAKFYANELIHYFNENNDPSDDIQSEILLETFLRSINDTWNDKWYNPSQGATFSNIMSWATLPDGFYYPELISRGVAAGLGAVIHQIFLQFDPTNTDKCAYWGEDGAGKMSLVYNWVLTVNILLGIIICITVSKVLLVYLDNPVRDPDLLREGLRASTEEGRRLMHLITWTSSFMKKHGQFIGNIPKAQEAFEKTEIRYGYKKHHVAQGNQEIMIGPLNEVMRMKPKSEFKVGRTKSNKEMPANELDENLQEVEEEEDISVIKSRRSLPKSKPTGTDPIMSGGNIRTTKSSTDEHQKGLFKPAVLTEESHTPTDEIPNPIK